MEVQMTAIKRNLLQEAKEKYSQIFPCGNNSSLQDCFTEEDGLILFWFNTSDCSTHMLTAESM